MRATSLCGICAKLVAEQEGIADRGRVRGGARADKRRGDLLGVAFQSVPRRAGAEIDVTERQPVLGPEPLRVGREVGRELLLGRLRGSHVLGDELHLLPQAAADDDVVAVEARRPAFAIEDLVADVILDQALQLLLRSADAARCARTGPRGCRRAGAETTIFAGASASFLPTRP